MQRKYRFILPWLSALLFTFAWPEKGLPFLIFTAWIPLFYLSDYYSKQPRKRFFPVLYLTFFLFNLFLTYWIWYATKIGAVLAIFANAFLMATTFWIWHKSRTKLPGNMAWVFFPALWISFEKLHYEWDLEWPWLTMGNVFAAYPEIVQWYEYTGVFGGSLWVLTVNLLLYFWIKHRSLLRGIQALALLIVPIIFSVYLYNSYQPEGKEVPVLILQPDIDPWTEKFDRSNEESMRDLLDMAETYADSVKLIIAPETALSRTIDKNKITHKAFYRIWRDFQARHPLPDWLIGASLYRFLDQTDSIPLSANRTSGGRWYQLYNSALYFSRTDKPQMYHKKLLVVGAEKMPFHKYLSPIIGDVVLDLGGTTGTHTPSPEPVVFTSSDGKIKTAPVICYESVFGDYVRKYVLKGANLLAVITNDGWWKKTGGYRQHFHYARLRSIENRRDLVRSANTGRSGHINQRGDVTASLEFGKRGVLLVKPKLNERITFYARYGDYIARIAVFVALILLVYALGKKRTRL